MTIRHRNEAAWTHEDALVRGHPRRDRAWVLIVLAVLGVVVITLSWSRMMGISDVTYEYRVCREPLTQESTWSQVQAASCDVAPLGDARLTLWAQGDQQEPDVTAASSWTFEDVPVNTSATAVELDVSDPATSVVLAEPTNQQVRRALTSDTTRTTWSANVGARGPVTYWVLVTPTSQAG